MANLGNVMSYVLIVSSVFIGVVVMLLISSLSLEAYFYDISLFKVIGYTDKEIQTVFINSYRLYTALLFLLTIPFTLGSFYLITWYLSSQFGMVFPMSLDWLDYLIGFVLTMSIFYISVPIAKHKLNKHSLQQALMIYEV
jgi:putative ABC transport system permease protein